MKRFCCVMILLAVSWGLAQAQEGPEADLSRLEGYEAAEYYYRLLGERRDDPARLEREDQIRHEVEARIQALLDQLPAEETRTEEASADVEPDLTDVAAAAESEVTVRSLPQTDGCPDRLIKVSEHEGLSGEASAASQDDPLDLRIDRLQQELEGLKLLVLELQWRLDALKQEVSAR